MARHVSSKALQISIVVGISLVLAGCAFAPLKVRTEDPASKRFIEGYYRGELGYTCEDADPASCISILGSADYFEPKNLWRGFGDESGRCEKDRARPYQLTVALGGGGLRAANFSMGVLAALHDRSPHQRELLINDVDAISSVSGGSYAALWYFSRLIDLYQIAGEHRYHREGARPIDSLFADCLPSRYAGLTREPGKVCPESVPQAPGDPFRFQNNLRGSQKLFLGRYDESPSSFWQEGWFVTQGFLRAVGTLPVYAFTRLVFDWRGLSLPIYPAEPYFDGIEKAYSLRPVRCTDETTPCDEHSRPVSNEQSSRGHTMSAFASLYYNQAAIRKVQNEKVKSTEGPDLRLTNIPFWIANSNATVDFFQPDIEDSVFEFTPFGFGSPHLGYWIGAPPNLELHRIAGASAAFLSPKGWTGGVLRLFNLNWEFNIANPRYPNSARNWHMLLPFPFYYLHKARSNTSGLWLRINDGGIADNTGIWSLVRRGAGTIVYADHTQDEHGRFEDLCEVRRQLARGNRRIYLRVPELARFGEVCAGKRHYDVWNWNPRLVRGCITTDARDKDCSNPRAAETAYFARLFVIKPALDLGLLEDFTSCHRDSLADAGTSTDEPTCLQAFERLLQQEGYSDFPHELFGFLVEHAHELGYGVSAFPQDNTRAITLGSDSFVYGAYRELAHWQAARLREELASPVRPLTPVVRSQRGY